jgi:hypothetical protein
MTGAYLTRAQVAERYPISSHTLAKLAAQGRGPRFYKPTDKCLYRPEDIEAWIEASVVLPVSAPTGTEQRPAPTSSGRGRARPKSAPRSKPATGAEPQPRSGGRKSLPPSPNSWLLRQKD